MEKFKMLVLHTIMWRRRWRRKRWSRRRWRRKRWSRRRWRHKRRNRRRWRRKRRNMWVHPINIKRPDFEIFSHLYSDLLEDEEKFHEYRAVLQSVTTGGIRNEKQNTNYMRAIKPEERLAIFFEVRPIKVCRRQEMDSRYYWSYPFS